MCVVHNLRTMCSRTVFDKTRTGFTLNHLPIEDVTANMGSIDKNDLIENEKKNILHSNKLNHLLKKRLKRKNTLNHSLLLMADNENTKKYGK